MNVLKTLLNDNYPVLDDRGLLKEDANTIADYVSKEFPDQPINFVGMGTSGAMIMTAIAITTPSDLFSFHVLRKPSETTHRTGNPDVLFEDKMIVIVDDLVGTGSTMINIANILTPRNKHSHVIGVCARNADEHEEELLQKLFPNLKFIIH